jgi:hypothetical protein
MNILAIDGYLSPDAVAAVRGEVAAALHAGVILEGRGRASWVVPLDRVLASAREVCDAAAAVTRAAFPDLPELATDAAFFARLGVGGGHVLHADAVTLAGEPNHTPGRVAAALVYLTGSPEDFRGGAIEFPGLRRSVAPKAGQLLAFPSTVEYRHRVTAVTPGTAGRGGVRDSIAIFFKPAA